MRRVSAFFQVVWLKFRLRTCRRRPWRPSTCNSQQSLFRLNFLVGNGKGGSNFLIRDHCSKIPAKLLAKSFGCCAKNLPLSSPWLHQWDSSVRGWKLVFRIFYSTTNKGLLNFGLMIIWKFYLLWSTDSLVLAIVAQMVSFLVTGFGVLRLLHQKVDCLFKSLHIKFKPYVLFVCSSSRPSICNSTSSSVCNCHLPLATKVRHDEARLFQYKYIHENQKIKFLKNWIGKFAQEIHNTEPV